RDEPGPLRAARRSGEPVRAADDALRRGLPRDQQPARGDDRRDGGRLRPGEARRRHADPPADGPRRRPHRRQHRGPPREDPAQPTDRRAAGRPQPADGRRPGRLVSRGEHAVCRRVARGPAHGVRTERRARDPGRALGTRRRGPDDVVTRPQLCRPDGRRRTRSATVRRRGAGDEDARLTADDAGGALMADPTPRPTPDLSRRRFLQGTALAGVATFLAACGTKGTSSTAPSAAPSTAPASTAPASASASAAPSAPAPSALANVGGTLNFANWIGYIDVDDSGAKHPTLDKFTKEQGTKVNYVEAIDGNEEFYAKIQGQLSAGLPTEWDLMVVTDWMVARLVRLGWLDEIDKSQTPNFPANLLESYIGRSFDPDTKFAAPWQSGMTGLGFDKKKTGALDSLEILF